MTARAARTTTLEELHAAASSPCESLHGAWRHRDVRRRRTHQHAQRSRLTRASDEVRPDLFSLVGCNDLERTLEASGLGERLVDCVDLSRAGTGPARLLNELHLTVGELQVASSEVPEPHTLLASPHHHIFDELLYTHG